jgi:hypothetical protein
VTDKAEVAAVTALAEGFGADEVDVVKVAVVDDVAMAEHRAEAFKNAVLGKQVLVKAFQCFKVIILLGIFRMPYILPTLSGTVFEPERDNLPHDREEERQLGHLLKHFRG